MRLKKIVEAADAVAVIHDGDIVASVGYGGNGTPDQLFVALEKRFVETATPRDLTLVFSTGQGDMKERGLNRLAHEGLVRRVIGGYFGLSPAIEKLIVDNRIQAYNLPEGVLDGRSIAVESVTFRFNRVKLAMSEPPPGW